MRLAVLLGVLCLAFLFSGGDARSASGEAASSRTLLGKPTKCRYPFNCDKGVLKKDCDWLPKPYYDCKGGSRPVEVKNCFRKGAKIEYVYIKVGSSCKKFEASGPVKCKSDNVITTLNLTCGEDITIFAADRSCYGDGNANLPPSCGSANKCSVCKYSAEYKCPGAKDTGDKCRRAKYDCDKPAVCEADSTKCPDNGFAPNTTVCRPAYGKCDVAEYCTGTSKECPSNKYLNGTVCRRASGDCDVAEKCSGDSADCPKNKFLDDETVCRPADGKCDIAEKCTGYSADCPKDKYLEGTVCRAANGTCDAVEKCSGYSKDCPKDEYLKGKVCRRKAGRCDEAEKCDGKMATCPEDKFLPNTTICRHAKSLCDEAEYCPGNSAKCPPDVCAKVASKPIPKGKEYCSAKYKDED